jgi:serine-type D-Ala-D-Ala carboxypeptidase (penicillin-binding protein 5/6)
MGSPVLRLLRDLVLAVMLCVVLLLAVMTSRASGPAPSRKLLTKPAAVQRSPYGSAPAPHQLHIRLKLGLESGLLFDVRTGRVLWARRPGAVVPIASLTKMMTALIVVTHTQPSDKVLVTKQAVHFTGSGMGVLPVHRYVPERTLLYGLLLPSGNDAAIALAQHVTGSVDGFIAMMNARAKAMNLTCTHFTTVSGVVDRGNYSCTRDLAVLAHAVLKQPLLAKIVATRMAVQPLPIKGGKVWLYNNNPLLVERYPGTDGVKTGFTTKSGVCLVAAARRGKAWLGVILLHSANIAIEAEHILNAGFAAERPD